MLCKVAVSCLALLAVSGGAVAQSAPAGAPPIEPGGRFLLVLLLAGAGLLAVRKERR